MKTCWEIRQEFAARPANERPNGWLKACGDCAMPSGGQACWERCAAGPRCCAAMDVTCDFCEIYIEHRREIAALVHQSPMGTQNQTTTCLSHLQGGKPVMEKLQFNVPNLWADHHTLKVREVLTATEGVQDVIVSSAFRMVALAYDPAVVTPAAIAAALIMAGYPVAQDGKEVVAQPVPMADGRKDPAWDRLGLRVSHSDPRDVKK